jgi:hypothetical protein
MLLLVSLLVFVLSDHRRAPSERRPVASSGNRINRLNPTLKSPNITTIMVKNLLWPFVVIAGLSLANPSKAALGWTLAECKAHWGQPIAAPTLSTRGQKQVDFAAHQYRITVWLTGGKVVRVAYQPQYSTLSEPDLNKLLAANNRFLRRVEIHRFRRSYSRPPVDAAAN